MSEISSPQLSVENLMDRLQETIERQQENGHSILPLSLSSFASSYPAPPVSSTSDQGPESFSSSAQFHARADDHYKLADLTQYHDADFVRHAYLAILHRAPDEAGAHRYLQGLRSGVYNKTDILASMRYSPEGESHNVRINGLRTAYLLSRAGRLPVLGYLINIIIALYRLPVLVRQQQQFESHTAIQDRLLRQQIESAGQRMQNLATNLNRHYQEVSEHERQLRLQTEQNYEQFNRTVEEHAARLAEQQALLDEHDDQIERQSIQLSESKTQQSAQHAQLQSRNLQLEENYQRHTDSLTELRQQIKDNFAKLHQTRRELTMQERRLTLLLEEARRSTAGETLSPVKQDVSDHFHDAFYASFEDLFRGTREDIKNRLRVHLDIIKQAGIEGAVLDIGCGRGEWLELLKDHQIGARGVDLNRLFVEECRAQELEVIEADALAYLRTLPDHSLSAVTSFHLIEHLPFEILVKLLDEILRVLKINGVVILETPNPENLTVGSYYFYTDPTHRNPLPSQTMQFLLESRGFSRIKVMRLHPADESRIEGDEEIVRRFNDFFYGPLDYAITGWKI